MNTTANTLIHPDFPTDVSPSVYPENITSDKRYQKHAQHVTRVVDTYTRASTAIKAAFAARDELIQNETVTENDRILTMSDKVDKIRSSLHHSIHQHIEQLDANIKHYESKLNAPLTAQAGVGTVNTEIRNHSKYLSRGQREEFINTALEKNDTKTLGAICGSPHYLSGLTEAELNHCAYRFHSNNSPELVDLVDYLKNVRDRVGKLGPIINSQFEKAVGADHPRVGHLVAERKRAQDAFKTLD